MDTRGQSIGITRFFLVLAVGGVCMWLLTSILADRILPRAENATSNATANQATGWLYSTIDLAPVIIILLAFLSVIIVAVFQREVLR